MSDTPGRTASKSFRLAGRLAFLCLLILAGCGKTPPPAATVEAAATNPPAQTEAVRPEYTKLVGRWERPDGGYILNIGSVNSEGVITAGYFNPAPINVSKAKAIHDSDGTRVFIELRDANYPGCTYSLKYDSQSDQLFGQYFQAALQETYDVTFARLKEQ